MASFGAMTLGSLSFAAKDWFGPVLFLFLLGLVFIWRSYPSSRLSPGIRAACFALKTFGLALLLSFLLEPMWTTTRPREGANLFAVVADNSIGLQLRDPGETQTRADLLRHALTSNQEDWQARLEETFMVRRYLFDSRLQSTMDFSDLDFEGRDSALGAALSSIGERFSGQPLAGVLVFTDGIATDIPSAPDVAGLPPIYPVVLGSDEPLRDLSLQKVSVSQTVFEDAPVTVTASARADGFADSALKAELILSNKVVASEVRSVEGAADDIPLRFEVKPEQHGISFYNVRLSLADSDSPDTNLTEATSHNNQRLLAVDRGSGPHRILYVSGRPNWDFKFLNRAVSEDPQVQLVALIRIARREPKFTFQGHTGESSNPLFRGFKQIDEDEAERYDQPVLIRLNTKNEEELRDGFPKTAEDLFGFKAVILDDIEAEFFTTDQMLLLQRFVSERGGGFLMLGGADSLQDGGYARTPVGDMLPVYLDRLSDTQPTAALQLDLTREGWLQPWIRLRSNEQDERTRLDSLPSYQVVNQLREIKPGATVLATAKTRSGAKFPAVAMQRFGKGRVAAISIGDLWRSGFTSEKSHADLAKSWRQMMRWVIADVPARVELRAEPAASGEGAMLLQVRALDAKFEPLDNASVQLTITGPSPDGQTNNTITMPAEPSDAEPGVYQATYVPRESGAYIARAMVLDNNSVKVAEAETGWASEPMAREFQSLTPNRPLLEDIARKTGGEVLRLNGLDQWVQTLKKKKVPILETYSYPLWHKSSIFVLALACFTTEWGLRRWKGLA